MTLLLFRRELADHLMSLRFALTLLITVALMVVNGILFSGAGYGLRVERYQEGLKGAQDGLAERVGHLGDLAERGPGVLYKRPSPLGFAATGREEFLPASVEAQSTSSYGGSWGFYIAMPWHLRYGSPQVPPSTGIVPDFVEVDWVFVTGFCLSLMALLLTYDGVCGERGDGTLRLLLSGPVPRHAVLLGKFAAAWAVLASALAVGLAVSLLILGLTGPVALDGALWARVALIYAASLLYLASFVGLGLFISARSARPSSSLVSLLLVWTVLLVLLPNTTAGVASSFQEPEADWKAHQSQLDALMAGRQIWNQRNPVAEGERPPREFVQVFSDFLEARLRLERPFEEDRLRRQLEPVELGRTLNRVSPYGTFQFAMESLAGTGLPRHLRFLEAARQYERTFRQFVDERDQADPASYHLFGLAPGLSAAPVPVAAVPAFHEDQSLGATLADTGIDLALLALFALAAFLAAHAAFLRGDVT